jgi:DnaJ-class molecular chaperone
MTLKEMLTSPEAKKMYRELVLKYHPDSKSGNEDLMKQINAAKDKNDYELKKLYKELIKTKEKEENYSDINNKKNMRYYSNLARSIEDSAREVGMNLTVVTRKRENSIYYDLVLNFNNNIYRATIFNLEKYKTEKEILDKIFKSFINKM